MNENENKPKDKKKMKQDYRTKINCPECHRDVAQYMFNVHRRAAHPQSLPAKKKTAKPKKEHLVFEYKENPVLASFPTGATRSKLDVGRVDLIPAEVIYALGRRLELGVKTHGARNWENGIPYSELVQHTQMHLSELTNILVSTVNQGSSRFPLVQQNDGQDDTLYGHACAVLTNAAFLVTFIARGNPAEKIKI